MQWACVRQTWELLWWGSTVRPAFSMQPSSRIHPTSWAIELLELTSIRGLAAVFPRRANKCINQVRNSFTQHLNWWSCHQSRWHDHLNYGSWLRSFELHFFFIQFPSKNVILREEKLKVNKLEVHTSRTQISFHHNPRGTRPLAITGFHFNSRVTYLNA